MQDQMIDNLLKRRTVEASADFSARALARIKGSEAAGESVDYSESVDSIINGNLRRYSVRASSDFCAKALRFAVDGEKPALFKSIIAAFSSFAAAAACLVVAFMPVPQVDKPAVSEEDFVQVSNLSSQIDSIANLIAEHEVINTIGLK